MADIAVVTSQVPGNVNASSELVRRLTVAGHHVVYMSPFDISELVSSLELVYQRVGSATSTPGPLGREDLTLGSRAFSFAARLLRIGTIRQRSQAKVDAWELDQFEDALREFEPELVIIDMELPLHVMSAVSPSRSVAVWTPHMALWKRRGLPPLHSYSIPHTDPSRRSIRVEIEWLGFRIGRWLTTQRQRITRIGEDPLTVIRTAAARSGFDLQRETSLYQWFKPVVFRELPLLIFNAWELEFPHDPHPTHRYIGPMVRPLRGPSDSNHVQKQLLYKLIQSRERETDRRLIYASFGTWHRGDDVDLFRRIISAVRQRPEWDLVIGLGGRIDQADLGTLPQNVHVFEYAPQLEVLQLAECALNHAGINSVNECIRAGVPMLLYPFGFLDQPGTAARVIYHGLGVLGDRQADDPQTIEDRIDEILSDDAMKSRLTKMQKVFADYEIDRTAVETVESLL